MRCKTHESASRRGTQEASLKIVVREQIVRSPDLVFHALSRPEMYLSKWSRGVLKVASLQPSADGHSRPRYQISGRNITGTVNWVYEVLDSQPNQTLAGQARGGPVPFKETFSLRAVSEGVTELTHTHEIRPAGLFGLLSPVFGLVWPKLLQDNLRAFKLMVEAGAADVVAESASNLTRRGRR